MLRFSLRQSIVLWGISSVLIVFLILLGSFLPAEAQLLLKGSDGVYLQEAGQRYYFFNESALPLWSPDGEWIALQGENKFFLSDSASRIHYELDLQADEHYVYHPVWSDDSQKIAVLMEEATGGSFRLLIIDCLTKEVSNYEFPSGDTVLLWWESSDTIRFVTVGEREVKAWNFGLGDAAAQSFQSWRFTSYRVRNAVLNPDRQGFILPSMTTTLQNFELYYFDMAGTVDNISNRSTHNDTNPIWSPDGSRLAYRASADSSQFIILKEAGELEAIVGRFDNVFLSDMEWFDNQTLSIISSYSGRSSLCSLDILSQENQCSAPGISYSGLSWRPR
jgi:Tol biopolymer transport system component